MIQLIIRQNYFLLSQKKNQVKINVKINETEIFNDRDKIYL
jgi:hypothetical protein